MTDRVPAPAPPAAVPAPRAPEPGSVAPPHDHQAPAADTDQAGTARRGRLRRLVEWIPPHRRLPYGVYAATQAVLLIWWLAFFPGLTSYDSVAYVWQATTDNWMTNHSIIYTSLVWLSIQAVGGLWLLTLAQIVAAAIGLAYAVAGLRALGVPGKWLAIAAVIVPFVPSLGTFLIFVWKDVPFVILQLFMLGTLARVVVRLREPAERRWYRDPVMRGLLLWLFVESLLMALFRQNGFLMVVVGGLVAALVLAGVRLWMIGIGMASAALSLLLNLVVFPAMGAEPAKTDLVLGPAYADIAVVYHDRPEVFTALDREVMSRVAPLSFWSDSANCWTSDTTTNSREFDRDAAQANDAELFALWVRLLKRVPNELLDTRFCRGSIAWKIGAGPERIGTVLTPLTGSRNLYGFGNRMAGNPYRSAIYLDPPVPVLHEAAQWVRKASDLDTFKPLLWRGATWCYIGYLAIALFALRRRELTVLALAAVSLSNQLPVLANNPSQLVRYMMGPMYVGILLLPLLFVKDRRAMTRDHGVTEAER
jgi:hypothetical protein